MHPLHIGRGLGEGGCLFASFSAPEKVRMVLGMLVPSLGKEGRVVVKKISFSLEHIRKISIFAPQNRELEYGNDRIICSRRVFGVKDKAGMQDVTRRNIGKSP